jgi:hypothetical protein
VFLPIAFPLVCSQVERSTTTSVSFLTERSTSTSIPFLTEQPQVEMSTPISIPALTELPPQVEWSTRTSVPFLGELPQGIRAGWSACFKGMFMGGDISINLMPSLTQEYVPGVTSVSSISQNITLRAVLRYLYFLSLLIKA